MLGLPQTCLCSGSFTDRSFAPGISSRRCTQFTKAECRSDWKISCAGLGPAPCLGQRCPLGSLIQWALGLLWLLLKPLLCQDFKNKCNRFKGCLRVFQWKVRGFEGFLSVSWRWPQASMLARLWPWRNLERGQTHGLTTYELITYQGAKPWGSRVEMASGMETMFSGQIWPASIRKSLEKITLLFQFEVPLFKKRKSALTFLCYGNIKLYKK